MWQSRIHGQNHDGNHGRQPYTEGQPRGVCPYEGQIMRYDPEEHHRQSVRLKGYDYNQAGAYFVTIVTQSYHCVFGEIINGTMRLNDAGQMSQTVWDELPVFLFVRRY